MCSRYWGSAIVFLILAALFCPFPLIQHAAQAAEGQILDLQLDAPEAIRWDIGNIMPGDTGVQVIDLHNAGNIDGFVYIWIDDLVDGEGENPESETGNTSSPGELSPYISLDITNEGMAFRKLSGTGELLDIELPISLDSFPASSNEALYIINPPIMAGQTMALQWQWALSPSAGNELQGDTVSFSFYYMLVSEQSNNDPGGGYVPPETEPTTPPPPEPPGIPDQESSPVSNPPISSSDADNTTSPPNIEADDTDNLTSSLNIERIDAIVVDVGTTPADMQPLINASLGIAVSGTLAMTVLAIIQRRRRHSRAGLPDSETNHDNAVS